MLKRSLILAGFIWFVTWAAAAGELCDDDQANWSAAAPALEQCLASDLGLSLSEDGQVFSVQCCKVCTTGKACGNSCINRSYDCHQPPGCACDSLLPEPSELEPAI